MIFAATFLFGSAYFYSEIGRHPVPDHPFKVPFDIKLNFDFVMNFRLGSEIRTFLTQIIPSIEGVMNTIQSILLQESTE